MIKTKILHDNLLEVQFFSTRNLPKSVTELFIEGFVDEKLNLTWISHRHCDLKSTKHSKDTILDVGKMVKEYSKVTFSMEVFYFDGINKNDKKTQFAYRYLTDIDLIVAHKKALENPNDLNDILKDTAGNFYKKLHNQSWFLFEDPDFRIDKIRIYLQFKL